MQGPFLHSLKRKQEFLNRRRPQGYLLEAAIRESSYTNKSARKGSVQGVCASTKGKRPPATIPQQTANSKTPCSKRPTANTLSKHPQQTPCSEHLAGMAISLGWRLSWDLNSLGLFSYVRGMPLQTMCRVVATVGYSWRDSRNAQRMQKRLLDKRSHYRGSR